MSEFGKDINVPSRKGVFITDITVEMFRNASLEGVEDLMASGEMEDISLPSAQPERLTDDDFEAIRIHLNAYKEKLCNQQRWEEAEEYQRIIDRFMAFASAQPEKTCCGYNEKELIVFAIACRRNEVDEKDLKTFAQDCEFAWRVMQEEFESKIREAFEKWTGGKSDAD